MLEAECRGSTARIKDKAYSSVFATECKEPDARHCFQKGKLLSVVVSLVFVRLLSHSTSSRDEWLYASYLVVVFSFVFCLFLIFFFKVGFYSRYRASPGTHTLDQTGLKLTKICLFVIALEQE